VTLSDVLKTSLVLALVLVAMMAGMLVSIALLGLIVVLAGVL
jgi:hypothetical protein